MIESHISPLDALTDVNPQITPAVLLKTVITQKYIALLASIESWTDYRRTGFPELTPNLGGDHNHNPGGAIPRRLPYPQTERLYNKNFPAVLPNLQALF